MWSARLEWDDKVAFAFAIFFFFLPGKCESLNPQVIGHFYNQILTCLEVAMVNFR